MNISRIFIERPVLTTLFMAALVIFGVFGYFSLPVSDLPNVDFPTIQVSASLPGADPDTMASGVAAPLENQFSTIAGIDTMTSSSQQVHQHHHPVQPGPQHRRHQGVQAAISAARASCPSMPQPPTFRKVNPADFPDHVLDASETIHHGAGRICRDLLARQFPPSWRGAVRVRASKYAVRIQADPDALAPRQIGTTRCRTRSASNVNQATGGSAAILHHPYRWPAQQRRPVPIRSSPIAMARRSA